MPELSLTKSVLLTDLALCINSYRLSTPGIYVCILVPVDLGGNRFVPSLFAQVNHGRLKQCEATESGFMGPPNFVLDVIEEHELDAMEARKVAFGEAGVIEYVAIVAADEIRCNRFRSQGSEFEAIQPSDDGVIKSKALPGLWFSTHDLEQRDWWAMGDMISRGITRLGHHEFMETIWHKNGRDPQRGDWLPLFESG